MTSSKRIFLLQILVTVISCAAASNLDYEKDTENFSAGKSYSTQASGIFSAVTAIFENVKNIINTFSYDKSSRKSMISIYEETYDNDFAPESAEKIPTANFAVIPDGNCKTNKPKCEETGGECIFQSDKSLQCSCKLQTNYEQDVGCKGPCGSEFQNCEKSGGICVSNKRGNGLICKCPEKTNYDPHVGCKGICASGMENCENTGGICISNKKGDGFVCKCPDKTNYDVSVGCKGICESELKNCENTGGICLSNKRGDGFMCKCPNKTNYHSSVGCKDACYNFECRNGGKCEIKKEIPVCNCPVKFTGFNCEIDKCDSFCENGGTCDVENNKLKCTCPDEFIGDNCEKLHEDICNNEDPNCIKTGGSCKFNDDIIECMCPPDTFYVGYGGCKILCKEEKDCENGATCEENGDKSFCKCLKGTHGRKCEKVEECENSYCGDQKTSGANCMFDVEEEKAVCVCANKSLRFDRYSLKCRETCDNFDRIDRICENWGECVERENNQFCNCKNGTSGHHCEIIDGCKDLNCEKRISDCVYNTIMEEPFCKCKQNNTAYIQGKCIEFDGCILKMLNNECSKEHEICQNGKCVCEKGFILSKDKSTCEENKCAFCPKNSECDPTSDNPCQCKEGYYPYGNECVKYNECDVGFTRCTQECNLNTGACRCKEGFIILKDNITCEKKDTAELCDLDCSPGVCIFKRSKQTCACPELTHIFVNEKCIDKCTYNNGKPPIGLNCPEELKCEADDEHDIRCKCEDPYTQAEDGIHCIRKEMCKEDYVIEECRKKSALCRELPTGKGYECYCDKPFTFDDSNKTVCIRKCDLKKDECAKLNAVCDLNEEYEAVCKCPPLLTREDDNSPCSEIAKISFTAELTIVKTRYIIKDKAQNTRRKRSLGQIDTVKLHKDVQNSIEHVYGRTHIKSVNIVNITETEFLESNIELQFENNPEDKDALMKNCYPIQEHFCVIQDLVIKMNKFSNVLRKTNPCMVENIFCDSSTQCYPDYEKETFNCSCKKGFRSTGAFNPVNKKGNVVQRCENINECDEIGSCPENTVCTDTYGNYTCECASGFKRKSPESDPKVDGCEAVCDPNPCKNDGACVQKRDHGFMCRCKPFYNGITCNETVFAKIVEVDYKNAGIIGGVLGTLLLLGLVVIVFMYRRVKKMKEYEKRRQRSELAQISHFRSRQNNEVTDPKIQPSPSRIWHTRLQNESDDNRTENYESRIIPRIQASGNNNIKQYKRTGRPDFELKLKPIGLPSKIYDRLHSTIEFNNKAFDEEE